MHKKFTYNVAALCLIIKFNFIQIMTSIFRE